MIEKNEKTKKQLVKNTINEIKVLSKPIDIEKADLFYSCCRKSQRLQQLPW
ncbi:MAG: hypothetical protein IJK17_05135 [Lachnospiraceae bacterium]|nr:hypothetical protein [Lachnospiraceae bacterium]